MKSVFRKGKLSVFAAIVFLMAGSAKGQGISYIDNLGNSWMGGGIGDIHVLSYGPATARFMTGAGSFSVNGVTLEFDYSSSYPAGSSAPNWVSVQLFQQTGARSLLLGSFGNPLVDPMPTQWPKASNPSEYTAFIDFSPLSRINLNPFTQYGVVVSMANGPVDVALLFTKSSAYATRADWTMGLTTFADPFASGENLVMGVQATPVPEPNTPSLRVCGFLILVGRCKFMERRLGKK